MAVAWLFEDERTEAADAVLVLVTAAGANVPSLWRLEIASVLRNALRRGRCDVGFVDRSIDRLRRLMITVDGETDTHAWGGHVPGNRRIALCTTAAMFSEA